MPDIDCNSDMRGFHSDEVTLPQSEQTDMRNRRDAGRTRLANGLERASHPQPTKMASQGSYQMRTMVQDPDGDYDIDDGAYFEKDALTDADGIDLAPRAARERVRDALKWDGRLKMEAEIKDNCVRQYYAAGYHIDVPVYRCITKKNDEGDKSTSFELAGGDSWVESDARAVTKWFNDLVGELNSGESDGSQMRRVTKLTKKFARSRAAWKPKTTSGICITKLIVDEFVHSDERDDLALRESWKAIQQRLDESTEIEHPVNEGKLAEKDDEEIQFFNACLADALTTLEALDKDNCDRKRARQAWDAVFSTSYFSNRPAGDDDSGGNGGGGNKGSVKVTSKGPARRNDGGGRFG